MLINEAHPIAINGAAEDGDASYTAANWIDDNCIHCWACTRPFTSPKEDGRKDDAGHWFCEECLSDPSSGAVSDGDDSWKERAGR